MSYNDAEPRLREDYEKRHDNGRLGWEKAKHATQDAWNRVENAVSGYSNDEDTYWRSNYRSRPYAEAGYEYEDFAPAYRMGYEGYSTYNQRGLTYDQAEPYLHEDYQRRYGNHRLGWEKAKLAIRDAWNRVEHAVSGNR
jgi:hypothetical protein